MDPAGRDEEVATRDGLTIRTVLGDMRDSGVFADASFDVVFNPVSNVFCPDLAPVWRESFRVLRRGGVLLAGFMNPDVYVFDEAALERDELVVRHLVEAPSHADATARYMPGFFATRAVKPD